MNSVRRDPIDHLCFDLLRFAGDLDPGNRMINAQCIHDAIA
jgi:hypothetical protein|tara:strand:+ start:6095 stop:6217 length:123 start_codon:yes stop_codon:yes gene_type:complete